MCDKSTIIFKVRSCGCEIYCLTCFCFLSETQAAAPKCMKSPWGGEEESSSTPSKQEEAWPALSDRSVVAMAEQLFSHLLKVLNICAHVLEDTSPGPAVKVISGRS